MAGPSSNTNTTYTNTYVGYISSAITGLTTTYQIIELSNAAEVTSQALPEKGKLSWLQGQLDTIAGGATQVIWYLTLDAAGNIPVTNEVTETILVGVGDATTGGIATRIGLSYIASPAFTPGKLYVVAKTDAGTANIVIRATWEQ